MALCKSSKVTFLMVMTIALCGVSMGEVYKVGGSAAWSIGKVDYAEWSKSITFKVGDTIVFEYDKQSHNVLEVSYLDFKSCNGAAPIHTYATGNDSITIKKESHLYFLCGIPGHCKAGQKVDIRVASAPSLSVSPSLAPAPGPATGNACSIRSSIGLVFFLVAIAFYGFDFAS